MKRIKGDIYTEKKYAGVTVGALLLERGTLLVDAPIKPDDGKAWLSALRKKGAKGTRMLVSLDSHPDRTLGAHVLDSPLATHRESAKQFRRRAAVFKSLRQESGAEWERQSGLNGLRLVMPKVIFADELDVRLGDERVVVESHPGPSPGASWVVLPDAKVVFVGDAVAVKQPPFLGLADIPAWVESLDLLLSKEFKGYRVICGRGGEIKPVTIRAQRRFLKDVEARLGRMARRKAPAKDADKLVPKLLSKYKYPVKYKSLYSQRLRHGLRNYHSRHYQSGSKS